MGLKNKKINEALKKFYYEEKYKYNPKEENALKWNYSENFLSKMDQLIKKQKKSYWKYTNTFSKRLLIAIIVFILIFSSTMAVPGFRKPVVDFIVKVYNEFSEMSLDKNTITTTDTPLKSTIKEKYIPQYIPDGFEQEEYFFTEYNLNILWKNSTGLLIDFSQITSSSFTRINTEGVELNKFQIGTVQYYIYEQNGSKVYIWFNDGYCFILSLPNSCSDDEIIKILNNVKNTT